MRGKKTNPFRGKFVLAALLFFFSSSLALAEPLFFPLPPLQQSEAFLQFERRPVSELSKLYYLINRFKTCNIIINYDGGHYKANWAAPYVTAFLMLHYRKDETARRWVMNYCHRTPSRKLIWAICPDGTKRPASEVLLHELEILEKHLSGE